MQAAFPTDFQRLVSPSRFDAFRDGVTDVDALARCIWNTALCGSLYPVFQILEVGFRNAVHTEIGSESGVRQWLMNPPHVIQSRGLDTIEQARAGLRRERKPV